MALHKWKRKWHAVAADFDVGDSDSSGDGQYDYGELFDNSSRIETLTIEKEVWVLHARGIATRIRSGELRHIMWWSPRVSSPAVPLPDLRLSGATGLHSFQVDAVPCQNLVAFFEDEANYNKHGFLMMAGTQWPGYGSYPYVHANHHIQDQVFTYSKEANNMHTRIFVVSS